MGENTDTTPLAPVKIETAIIKIAPDLDPAVFALSEQIQGLLHFAEARTITCAEDMIKATEDMGLIKSLGKALEEKRKEYTGPIDQHLKEVREKFKVFTEPLARADRITQEKMLTYRHECQRKAAEAAEINRMREEAARREAALNNAPPVPVEKVEAPAPAPAHVYTEVANAGITKTRKYRITDFAALPDEYKMENSVLLNKVTRAGIPAIPGVTFYFEEGIRITR